jgi:alanine racemase
VRPGIMLYGYSPNPKYQSELLPVAEFQARIIDVKSILKGVGVSYNHTFKARKDSVIATIGAGYADGVPRRLSNKLKLNLKEHEVSQVGTICMDVCCVDVSALEDVHAGDWVTLFGIEGRLIQWSKDLSTIVYELLCHIGNRVERVWHDGRGIT